MPTVISVENLSKEYRLGQIGTGTLSRDLNIWWAKLRGKPNPLLKIGEKDHGNRDGETIFALKDVSFTVEQGEALGIIGRNGAGKSTLLKILSRVTAPTSGRVKVKGRIASLLEVGTGFHPDLTGRENIYLNGAILGMTRQEVRSKLDEIVDFSEIKQFIDTPVKRYSSGMYVRLAFAVAAHLDPEILVVDEVLAVGDAEFQKKCLGKMGDVAKGGRTVLFVSHNIGAVRHLCNKGIVLDAGETLFIGSVEEAVQKYERLAFDKNTNPQKEVLPSHIIYKDLVTNELESKIEARDFQIEYVEVLDLHDQPKEQMSTWDTLKFRIHYWAKKGVKNGSLVLQISTILGEPLILLSTMPDSNIPMEIRQGHHYGECIINQIPLASGEYVVGCGLAVPKREWLCWNRELAIITIKGRDVFNSGFISTNSRALLAVPHEWIIKQ